MDILNFQVIFLAFNFFRFHRNSAKILINSTYFKKRRKIFKMSVRLKSPRSRSFLEHAKISSSFLETLTTFNFNQILLQSLFTFNELKTRKKLQIYNLVSSRSLQEVLEFSIRFLKTLPFPDLIQTL